MEYDWALAGASNVGAVAAIACNAALAHPLVNPEY